MSSPFTVLAVPGIGLWPELFESTMARLRRDATGRPPTTEIITRPTDSNGFESQVEFLAEACARAENTVLVGVSGGATLALACAMRRIDGLRAIVTHEPLVGPLEPELHLRVARAGQHLAAEPSEGAALDFVAGLYNTGWHRAPPETQVWAKIHHRAVCAEVTQFASFRPEPYELELDVPHLTTVGANSEPERHRVRELLASTGARSATIDGSGHLVLVEQPSRFAAAISGFLDELDGSSTAPTLMLPPTPTW